MRCIGALLVLAGAVAGCGESNESSSGGDGGGGSQGEQTASCQPAPKTVLNRIEAGLEVQGGGNLRNGFAVKSADFEKVYMVAADIQGPGLESNDDIGVWATNSLGNGGLTMAVDGFAQEFSDWPDADKTDAGITQADDGVAKARSCVRDA